MRVRDTKSGTNVCNKMFMNEAKLAFTVSGLLRETQEGGCKITTPTQTRVTTNKKKHNKKVLLAKTKPNSIYILISKAFLGSDISHDGSVSINNVLK